VPESSGQRAVAAADIEHSTAPDLARQAMNESLLQGFGNLAERACTPVCISIGTELAGAACLISGDRHAGVAVSRGSGRHSRP